MTFTNSRRWSCLAGVLCGAAALGTAHGQIVLKPSSPTSGIEVNGVSRTCQALRDFERNQFEDATATPKDTPECGSLKHYKFLLAMVPDPINTHLALFFDRAVESIENAVGDLGWEFARYSFPWDPLLAKEETDADKRQKQKDARSEQEREPGVLLFRNRYDLKKHLAILLIAETPTAGLDRLQFETAWGYMGLKDKCASVQLIGPTFSGSFDSIRELGDCRRLIAFSGTATSTPALQEFENNGGLLHTFIHSDEWAEFQLTNHIRREWGNEGPIAILAEGETAFGTSFRASSNKRKDQDIVDVFRFQGKSRIFGMLMRQYQTFPARSNILYKADKAFLSISASIQARWPTPNIKTETRAFMIPSFRNCSPNGGKGNPNFSKKWNRESHPRCVRLRGDIKFAVSSLGCHLFTSSAFLCFRCATWERS
jgi:hypothetical protein